MTDRRKTLIRLWHSARKSTCTEEIEVDALICLHDGVKKQFPVSARSSLLFYWLVKRALSKFFVGDKQRNQTSRHA